MDLSPARAAWKLSVTTTARSELLGRPDSCPTGSAFQIDGTTART